MIKLNQEEQIEPEYLSLGGYCRFNRCPALYCFHSILGLRTIDTHTALSYGKSIHCAMPFLQRNEPQKALGAFSDSWKDGEIPDDKRNLERATNSLGEWYAKHKNHERYKIIEPPKTQVKRKEPMSDQEFAFVCSLGDDPSLLDFYGIVDAVAEVPGSDALWLVEYKTTSELGTRFINSFAINTQCIGYSLGVTLITGRKVEGVFVEAIRTTKTNAESLCIPVFVYEWQMATFLESYKRTCRLIKECLDSGEWPQLFCSCTSYDEFGQPGYLCKFADMCRCEDWRVMLDAYVVDAASPFEEIKGQT